MEIGGSRIHYVDSGVGRSIVLVHGLGGQLRHFTSGVVPQIGTAYRVVALDRPGSGWSTRGTSTSPGLMAQATVVAKLIDHLGLERPLVVGHSLGGAVALTLAIHYPRHAGGLALIAPLASMPEAVPTVFKPFTIRPEGLRLLFAHCFAVPRTILKRRAILEQLFGPEPVPPSYGLEAGGLSGLRPSQFLSAAADLQALPAELPAMLERIGEIRVPVHVLFARDDRILDCELNGVRLNARIPGSVLELVPGGHMLPVTQPELVSRFALEALAATDGVLAN